MTGVSGRDLRTMAGWPAGIDNMSPETDLPRDEKGISIIALREAENVDVSNNGKARRRAGRTLVVNSPRTSSLWRDGLMPFALYVTNETLMAFRPEGSFAVVDGLTPGVSVSYALVGERVFWSNGQQSGVVLMDGSTAPWGCPTPNGEPLLAASSAVGGLDAGTYQVAITWQLSTGEESGALLASVVDVPQGGGVSLSGFPIPPASVARVRIYVTPADGDVLYHAMDVAPGLPVALVGQGRRGKPLDTQFLDQMPAGQIVRWFNGRLYVADGDVLRWSEALRYGLTHPTKNALGFHTINMLEPVGAGTDAGGGLFIADGKRTYFLDGADPSVAKQRIANPSSVVPGTSISVDASLFGLQVGGMVPYWLASDGVACLGLPGGDIVQLRKDQAVSPTARTGASMLREQNGLRQIVTSLAETGPRGLQISDRAVVTVERYDQ